MVSISMFGPVAACLRLADTVDFSSLNTEAVHREMWFIHCLYNSKTTMTGGS